MTVSNNVGIDNAERNFSFDKGTSVFRTGTDGSRCSSYAGALGWSFASSGKLNVTFGGTVVNP